MKDFTSVHDISNPETLVQEALELKKNLYGFGDLGKNKTLGLVFLNPSLRTRMSSQKAGMNLGIRFRSLTPDRMPGTGNLQKMP